MSTTDSSFDALWRQAIDRYEAETNETIPRNLANFSVSQLYDEMEKILVNFKSYRAQNGKLRDAIKPIVVMVQSLTDAASQAAQSVFLFESFLSCHDLGRHSLLQES